MTTPVPPYREGTPLRCARPTQWGVDVVHGVVKAWHNDQGWVVVHPDGGIVAAPGEERYLGRDGSPARWSFTELTERNTWTEERGANLLVMLEQMHADTVDDDEGDQQAHWLLQAILFVRGRA